MTLPFAPSNLTTPPVAPPEATATPATTPLAPIPPEGPPTALKQLELAGRAVLRDPFGFALGLVTGPIEDLATVLMHATEEDLKNPVFRSQLKEIGVNPDSLSATVTANEKLRARGRLGALAGGAFFGGVTGLVTRTALSTIPAAAIDGIVFGTSAGALSPPEENQTRAGNALTGGVFGGIIGATVGGVTQLALRRFLQKKGVKPETEAPEVGDVAPEYSPVADAHVPITDPARLLPPAPERLPVVRGEPQTLARVASQQAKAANAGARAVRSPDYDAAIGQALDKIQVGGQRGRRPFTLDDLYTMVVDDRHPINVATKQLLRARQQAGKLAPGSRGLAAMDDPYVLSRLTSGSAAKATAALEKGPLDWRTLQPVGPGLREILRPSAAAGRLDELRAFLISPRTLDLAARKLKTPISPETAQAIIRNAPDDIVQAARQVFRFTDQNLQYLVDSGFLTERAAQLMRDANRNYVPFARVVDDLPATGYPGAPGVRGKFANLAGLKRAKGSERTLVDPLEAVIQNTYAMISLADRHAVSEALVRLAETVPDQQIVRPAEPTARVSLVAMRDASQAFERAGITVEPNLLRELVSAFQPKEAYGEGVIFVRRGGQRKFYRVDEPLYRALLAMDREAVPTLVRLLSFPTQVLKAGITLAPRFFIRNPARDQFTAAVFSRYGFKPVADLSRGIFHVLGRDQLYDTFRRSGAEHAALVREFGSERLATQKRLHSLLRDDDFLARNWNRLKGPTGWLEALRSISEAMEDASRVQEFARALAATGDERLAAFAARDVTLDFARMGAAIRIPNQLVAFLAATIQGTDKAIRAFREQPVAATGRAVAWITIPSIALWYLNNQLLGDDHREVYNELSAARKDFFWNVPLLRWNEEEGRVEPTGEFLSIPKPFELGVAFGSYPERVLDWIRENDPAAFEDAGANLISSLLPPFVPAAAGPAIEARTNFDFFRKRPIVPRGEEELLPREQVSPRQGETIRLIADALDVSPRLAEHVLRGYTGDLGIGATAIVDRILGATTDLPGPEVTLPGQRLPFVGDVMRSFLVQEPTLNSRSVERFYRKWAEVRSIKNTFDKIKREGRADEVKDFLQTFRTELAYWDAMNGTAEGLNTIRDAIRIVRLNKQIPDEAREQRILELGRAFRTLAAWSLRGYRTLQANLERSFATIPQGGPAVTTEVRRQRERFDGPLQTPADATRAR